MTQRGGGGGEGNPETAPENTVAWPLVSVNGFLVCSLEVENKCVLLVE